MSKPFLYIHIPKTAGHSIQKSGLVKSEDWKNHSKASEIRDIKQFYSFCFIRNPYDRMFSAYNFHKFSKEHVNRQTNRAIEKYESFESFVNDISSFADQDCKHNNIRLHFLFSQYDYITKDNKVIIDYVGRFDNMKEQFQHIQVLNPYYHKKYEMIVANDTNHKAWKTYYTDELSEIVYNHWKIDFQFFGFDI